MCKILCSTGALIGKPNNRDYKLLKDLSKQLTCDGFESWKGTFPDAGIAINFSLNWNSGIM